MKGSHGAAPERRTTVNLAHHGPTAAAIFFWIWEVLVIVGIAVLAVFVVRMALGKGLDGSGKNRSAATAGSDAPAPLGAAPATSNARVILDERLARGDIDPEDYQARLALLDKP